MLELLVMHSRVLVFCCTIPVRPGFSLLEWRSQIVLLGLLSLTVPINQCHVIHTAVPLVGWIRRIVVTLS